jgi:uncharacterized membrane protein
MTLAGRLHPLLVHFPIAFVLLAAISEIAAMTTRHPTWHVVARATVRAGALASVAAAIAGWLLAGAPDVGTAIELEWHRWLALGATAGVLAAATATAARPSTAGRWLYRVFLFASAAGIALAAHIGARLVWGADFLHL